MRFVPEGQYCGLDEARKIIGCELRTVSRMVADGRLRSWKFSRNVVIVRVDEVESVRDTPERIGRPRGA